MLYERLAGSSISSDPEPQEKIARVLTANAVSASGGSGASFVPELSLMNTWENELSTFPISVVPLATRSGMPSLSTSTNLAERAPSNCFSSSNVPSPLFR